MSLSLRAESALGETSSAAGSGGAALEYPSPRAPEIASRRPTVSGKFLFVGDQKLYVRGATYGTFRPRPDGSIFPSPEVVQRDFGSMAANGLNAVRTYSVPPGWLLDAAAENGLYVMVGIPWEQHVNFLAERARARSIEDRVREAVASCAGHPSVLCYAIGNEIPSPIARWVGRRQIERFLAKLYRGAKREDPNGLVTYVNFPPTEYLQLDFLDLLCFNVYLERRDELDAYLARLQNIAGDLPLLAAEVGVDSGTHGEPRQAAVLDWQIRSVFAAGAAGAFVFAWTDEWYVSYLTSEGTPGGGLDVEDWDFGLTRRDRRHKPALESVRRAFSETPFQSSQAAPRISVVVCTHNGEKTLPACLQGLRELEYEQFEVVVVDDGSTDSTVEIVEQFGFRIISTENRGLAAARNTGLEAATGEIVAYLDDDARPDCHWLRYLALCFQNERYSGIGGPNLAPADLDPVAQCVAEAPGGPTHVLLSDCEAEHIPGCNMAFRKRALEEVGQFDTQFRVAGDDVDICWRLREAGHVLGFSPSAFVWHQPRGSIGAYWRQQRGYGRAEAMLEQKWPDKYSPNGHARWSGRLYANGLCAGLVRWRVYYGTWGSELFQSLYQRGGGRLSAVVLGPPWYLVTPALVLSSLGAFLWSPLIFAIPLLLADVAAPLCLAGASAFRTRIVARRVLRPRELAARWLLTTLLNVIQPMARISGRVGPLSAARRNRQFKLPLPRLVDSWSEHWRSSVHRLADIEAGLRRAGAVVTHGSAYDRWDLQVRYGLMAAVRIRMGIEEHGAGRQLVHVRLAPRYSGAVLGLVVLLLLLAFTAAMSNASAAAAVLGAAAVVLGGRAVHSAGIAMEAALGQLPDSVGGEVAIVRASGSNVEVEGT